MVHSSGGDLHQVEQPLPLLRLLWPVDVEGGGAEVCQALSQIDDLQIKTETAFHLHLTRAHVHTERRKRVNGTEENEPI